MMLKTKTCLTSLSNLTLKISGRGMSVRTSSAPSFSIDRWNTCAVSTYTIS